MFTNIMNNVLINLFLFLKIIEKNEQKNLNKNSNKNLLDDKKDHFVLFAFACFAPKNGFARRRSTGDYIQGNDVTWL